MTTPSVAAGAYASLARIAEPSANAATAVGGARELLRSTVAESNGGQSFGDMLRTAVSGVIEAGRHSDSQSQALAAGKANVVDVVTAVAETEVAVETMVAVRDKIIAAYEEIMRMPI
jgi:flagellar hook-basal body complex protein FliE